ncbi:hypothetical protein Bealeia1_00496 [Candidatus Bealeia paramacronuclearis]|uniref:Uncharacterized protein n=2 Tax=Candidatus Bealeia paramacronuclearis TaxID=1921001 RepID=A0ABZ2C3G9_9PROT|nr:hypothetical protein [Candidatus Bealeia paramacronuclearis]
MCFRHLMICTSFLALFGGNLLAVNTSETPENEEKKNQITVKKTSISVEDWEELDPDKRFEIFWKSTPQERNYFFEYSREYGFDFWDPLLSSFLSKHYLKDLGTDEKTQILRLSYSESFRTDDSQKHTLRVDFDLISKRLETLALLYTQNKIAKGNWNQVLAFISNLDIPKINYFIYGLKLNGGEGDLYSYNFMRSISRLLQGCPPPDEDTAKLQGFIYGYEINNLEKRTRYLTRVALLYDMLGDHIPLSKFSSQTTYVKKHNIFKGYLIFDDDHPLVKDLIFAEKEDSILMSPPLKLRHYAEKHLRSLFLEERTVMRVFEMIGYFRKLGDPKAEYASQILKKMENKKVRWEEKEKVLKWLNITPKLDTIPIVEYFFSKT